MDEREPYRNPDRLMFSFYRPDEIRKLSVVELYNPNAFDALQHSTPGGLHDPHLGPTEQWDSCETCGLISMHCPGHIGHITLPLPVFNPVLLKTLYQLLKGSCLSCHRLLSPESYIQLALYQFQAVDYGLVGKVYELSEVFHDFDVIKSKDYNPHEAVNAIEQKLKSFAEEAIKGLDLEQCKFTRQVSSVVECRQRIMKDFFKNHFSTTHNKNCPHCGTRKQKIILRFNSHFVFAPDKKAIKAKSQTSKPKGGASGKENQEELSNNGLTPLEAKSHLDLVWKHDGKLLERLFGVLQTVKGSDKSPMNIFFLEVLLVPPTRFRPISFMKGSKYLNPLSVAFNEVLSQCVLLKNLLKTMKGEQISNEEQNEVNKIKGNTNEDKLWLQWNQLQTNINCVYSNDMDKLNKNKVTAGVKQVLEKKEGLLRKNMMGKRVNFAARSVIAPDPNIMVDEIGIPEVFAKKLTYSTPVTHWNVNQLRTAVLNGPDVYPGANYVEQEDGRVVKLFANKPIERNAMACKLSSLPPAHRRIKKGVPKKVHRHLQNGDILLLNRQPTLHKPSIMAHRARVLPGVKCIRLHYANCKAYNADFDGDEMNVHFPQNEVARSEGYNIVSVNHQYLVPKDGTPLSGLIQDFIVAGALLTIRGMFFSREDYQTLVYSSLPYIKKSIKMLPPCIMKPQKLWSGKQVVSTIIINVIPDGKPPPTVEGKAKVAAKHWQNAPQREWKAGGTPLENDVMTESEVIISEGELLCGVIDKAHVGPTPYGLVHCCFELYGGETSSALLTSLGRLFTDFLESYHGFSLGIEDILLADKAARKRLKVLRRAKKVGDKVVIAAFDVEDQQNRGALVEKLKDAHLNRDDIAAKTLDFEMKRVTEKLNNDMNNACIPSGLVKIFPYNSFQLMVESGAKGSLINAMQISCALGQVELEGRRVPLMLNGNTLPTFLPYDTSPRAGGFVSDTFLMGVPPAENYFHCMAGREGLVDTAVKTSRSGYLQRCLIKHLEGIVVNYDLTVRDSDGSVIQFMYGEDGLDVCKMQMLTDSKLHLLAKKL